MKKIGIVSLSLAALLVVLVAGAAGAGQSASYAVDWQVLSGGGAPASAGGVSLNGSLGQTAIGPSASTGYSLGAGYWFEQVAAGPGNSRIYLPIVLKNFVPLPDLVVDSLSATGDVVTVVIRNAGTAPAVGAFWVDVYFNPSQTPTVNQRWDSIASHGVVWGVTTTIAPGESLIMTNNVSDPYYFPSYSSAPPLPGRAAVYVLVDSIKYETSYGAVEESDEGNNLYGPVTSTAAMGQPAPTPWQGSSPSTEGLPAR
jgi:hypothetical protein